MSCSTQLVPAGAGRLGSQTLVRRLCVGASRRCVALSVGALITVVRRSVSWCVGHRDASLCWLIVRRRFVCVGACWCVSASMRNSPKLEICVGASVRRVSASIRRPG